jgi:hypothetical protein
MLAIKNMKSFVYGINHFVGIDGWCKRKSPQYDDGRTVILQGYCKDLIR